VAKRDPHEVLGVARDADAAHIKAAWRKLARAHHPDLTGDDPAASRVATRTMRGGASPVGRRFSSSCGIERTTVPIAAAPSLSTTTRSPARGAG